jgi:Tfp pilus assembly protein PilF
VLANIGGEHEAAELLYLDAMALEPGNATVMNNYGFSLLMRKKYQEA